MEDTITIEELQGADITTYSIWIDMIDLIDTVFDEFVGKDYSEKGNETFKDYIDLKKIMERLEQKTSQWFVAKSGDEIIGIMEIRYQNHIALFFVKKEFHRQGIGKKLIQHYKKIMKRNKVEILTVNSSIYAEKIYAKLGFIKLNDKLQERSGIRFIPMALTVT